jgi:hypothetical protein
MSLTHQQYRKSSELFLNVLPKNLDKLASQKPEEGREDEQSKETCCSTEL